MNIGYVRISTKGQNEQRQVVLMEELKVDKIFVDKVSGKSKERPQLKEMLEYVREGDTIIVESISRFARNTRDLLELIEILKEKKVEFVSKKESIDTKTATGKFMLTIFGAVAELEREYILDRQREGIEVAKANGKHLGRPKIDINDNYKECYYLWKSGKLTSKEAIQKSGYKKTSFYKLAKIMQKNKE